MLRISILLLISLSLIGCSGFNSQMSLLEGSSSSSSNSQGAVVVESIHFNGVSYNGKQIQLDLDGEEKPLLAP